MCLSRLKQLGLKYRSNEQHTIGLDRALLLLANDITPHTPMMRGS